MDEAPSKRLTGCAFCGRWVRSATAAEIGEALRDLPMRQARELLHAKGEWLICDACGLDTLHLLAPSG